MNAPFDGTSTGSPMAADGFVIRTMRDPQNTLDLRYGVAGSRAPRQFVFFLNGRTEWIEKYEYLIDDLQLPEGTGFVTMDHRGQGGSGGARAYVESYDLYAQDAAAVIKEVAGSKPYVIVSHSMGGLIALYATLKGYLAPRSLVLSSPLLGLPDRPVPRRFAKPIAEGLSLIGLGGMSSGAGSFTKIPFESNALTHHADRYARMQDTPYKIPGATFGWVKATFAAVAECFSPTALSRLAVPTLVLGGTKERVVDVEAFRAWVAVASQHAKPGTDVQLRLINGAKHELFSEVPAYYREAVSAVNGWLRGAFDGA